MSRNPRFAGVAAALLLLSGCSGPPPEVPLRLAKAEYARQHPENTTRRLADWKVLKDCVVFKFHLQTIAVAGDGTGDGWRVAYVSEMDDGSDFSDQDSAWLARCKARP